jgi:hypothetical protein
MEIIEWCDEFRSSKRGGTRKAEASGHGLFSNELDVWTASRHMIRDASTAIGWLLTFFLDNQSILLLLLIARDATVEDERIVEGTNLATLLNPIVIKRLMTKNCLIVPCFVRTKSSSYCGQNFLRFIRCCFISMWSTFLWR